MNDLARPALYDAYHHFEAVQADRRKPSPPTSSVPYAKAAIPLPWRGIATWWRKVTLAIFRTAGAYGATMASTYNSRDLVPEVLVDGDKYAIVANRIAAGTVMGAEAVPDWLK